MGDHYLDIAWGPSRGPSPERPTVAPKIVHTTPKIATVKPVTSTPPVATHRHPFTFTIAMWPGPLPEGEPSDGHSAQGVPGCFSRMWGWALLAIALGVLVSVALVRRQPRFAPANVELLERMTAKASQ